MANDTVLELATTEKSSGVGNAAKMREALEWLLGFGYSTTDGGFHMPDAKMAMNKIKAALSAPPRNCDVGTAEEQSQRFDAFCDAHKYVGDDGANWCSGNCPCYHNINCGVLWAQMPYPEGGAK